VMAKILVTGASGYIGSHVAGCLRDRGHEVTATSRRITPELEAALPGCQLEILDVTHIPASFQGGWDCILHTATANDILSRDFEAGVALSAFGTRKVLDLARRCGVPHVVFFSTLQVYGAELSGVIGEDAATDPVNDYGLNHEFGEQVCLLESKRPGLRMTVLRPANVYGCPVSRTVDRWSLVPTCFVREALSEGTITIRSSGLQRRDFVSLRQVSEACLNVIESGGDGFVVRNIATGLTHSIVEAARWTAAAFESLGLPRPGVRVLGDTPRDGNVFEVKSSVTPPPFGGSVEAEMLHEITRLISFFQTPGPEPSTQP
jgi:UDP-glucose 4-epimerase